MNIYVLATASRASGALSVYLQFMEQLAERNGEDNYFVFVDPSMPKPIIHNVRYIVVNTRGLRRVFFDFYGFRRHVKQLNVEPDVILSFQNTGVKGTDAKQVIYFHNVLPLASIRWNPFKREERTLYFYTSLYPLYVRLLLKKSSQIVVQANFLKTMFAKRFDIPLQQIHVIRPVVHEEELVVDENTKQLDEQYHHFIYPASAFCYKNHAILVQALAELKRNNFELASRIKLHFTLTEDENRSLYNLVKTCDLSDNVVFHGIIPPQILHSIYRQSTALLFPSWLETVGLPLIEAASLGIPVSVCNEAYAHEALAGYDGVEYIERDDIKGWAKTIENRCNISTKYSLFKKKENNPWSILLDFLQKTVN